MGKIKRKIGKAFDMLKEEGDFEGFVLKIAEVTDSSVRFSWQYPHLRQAIKSNLEEFNESEALSKDLLAKRDANRIKD